MGEGARKGAVDAATDVAPKREVTARLVGTNRGGYGLNSSNLRVRAASDAAARRCAADGDSSVAGCWPRPDRRKEPIQARARRIITHRGPRRGERYRGLVRHPSNAGRGEEERVRGEGSMAGRREGERRDSIITTGSRGGGPRNPSPATSANAQLFPIAIRRRDLSDSAFPAPVQCSV